MTSGQEGRGNRFDRVPARRAAAVLLAVATAGCSPLQKTWGHRFGEDRLAAVPHAHPHPAAAPPAAAGGPAAADPYGARLALEDRRADPVGLPPRDASGDPTVGAIPLDPPRPAAAAAADPAPASLASARPDGSGRPPVPAAAPIAVPPAEPAPPAEAPPEAPDDLDAIDRVVDLGIDRLDGIRNYRVTIDRQERVRGALLPEERVTLSVRTEPFAVRLEWPDGPSKGREVLYSEAECKGMMHIKLAKTLIPVPPMQLEPNSPLAMSNSRHPITEAGLLHILTRTRDQVAQARDGDAAIGTFALIGPKVPEDFAFPCIEVVRDTPEGEHWRLVVEESTSLPVLLQASDAQGQLLERYLFTGFQADLEELDDSQAFDPAARFGRPLALPVDRLASGPQE